MNLGAYMSSKSPLQLKPLYLQLSCISLEARVHEEANKAKEELVPPVFPSKRFLFLDMSTEGEHYLLFLLRKSCPGLSGSLVQERTHRCEGVSS